MYKKILGRSTMVNKIALKLFKIRMCWRRNIEINIAGYNKWYTAVQMHDYVGFSATFLKKVLKDVNWYKLNFREINI